MLLATKDIPDKMVCLAYANKTGLGCAFADEALQKISGAHPKVCLRAMERACRRGLIDYGVTLRSGWLTEKGKELLRP